MKALIQRAIKPYAKLYAAAIGIVSIILGGDVVQGPYAIWIEFGAGAVVLLFVWWVRNTDYVQLVEELTSTDLDGDGKHGRSQP